MSVTTASGSSGWTAGSPFSVTTASGNAGWTSGSPLSVTTASGNSGWIAGSTTAPAWGPVYSGRGATFSGSTIAPACTPVYSGSGAICSGSPLSLTTVSGDSGWTSGSPLSVTTASGNAGWTSGTPFSVTTASGNAGWTSGSPLSLTIASGNSGWIAGSPLSVTTASGNAGWTTGSTIAPDCTSPCSAPVLGCSFITWAFLVPFSTILKTGAVVEVEIISLETSSLFTENTLTTSTFLPNLPSCFTLTVPSAKSGFSWTSSWKSIFVSIVSSRYKSSGLFNWPDRTSSCGFSVFTPVLSFGETFSSFFVSRFLCSANCSWESKDCISSFLGFVNSVEKGFSTTWTSVGLVEETGVCSWIACPVDGFSTKFGVTL